jgi:aryl-alcohol dehydrogenase-like predicted oxidoreductase
MVELKVEGRIDFLGLSEVLTDTLGRAHKIHPTAAVQVEYSPFALDIESEQIKILKTCREPIDELEMFAENKGCSAGQLTLAWLLAQGDDIIPIPYVFV